MNKTELVAAIAERTELTKKDADQALKAFIDVVGDELSKGEKIQLAGFGTFEVTERAARDGINLSLIHIWLSYFFIFIFFLKATVSMIFRKN